MTRFTQDLGIHTAMTPAAKNPATSHGYIAANTSMNEISRSHIVFMECSLKTALLYHSRQHKLHYVFIRLEESATGA